MISNKIDCIVVGCGLSGSVIARFLAEEMGKQVLVLERRNHVGGNMYDYVDAHGILVHKYGPHIFHTQKKSLYDYICRFGNWNTFYLQCETQIEGKNTPSPFNFQTIDDFYSPEKARFIKKQLFDSYPNKKSISVFDLLRNSNKLIQDFGIFLFEKDYKPYTEKQWGMPITKLDQSILKRVPVYLSYHINYFDDYYQVVPSNSYTDFFNNLLNHPNIKVELNINALEHIKISPNKDSILLDNIRFNKPLIYTGALDELFDGSEGFLPYRSLFFEWKYENMDSFQKVPIVAYPQAKNFTRISEYKKIPIQYVSGTTYAIEYPLPYQQNKNEPYYPILTEESQKLHYIYRKKADMINNFYYCGRLADFKYYNMDQALERALDICSRIERF